MKTTPTTLARATCALCLAALALACRSADTQASANPGVPAAGWSGLPEPALYARDGSVVQGTPPAGASTSDPRHDVGVRDGSRMYLLELYQKTVEEKEALAHEVQNLQAALARAGEAQAAIEKERDDARAQNARSSKELEQARTDNTDLAARLVTAQIRRLEAEKLVLEGRIEALRRDGMGASGSTIETSPPKTTGAPKAARKAAGADAAHDEGRE